MAVSRDFIELIEDALAPLGIITVRRMFGGAGVYSDGLMFALLDDDQLYFKMDDENRLQFDAADLDYFTYQPPGKEAMRMKYRAAPETALDDFDELLHWARLGIDAALRAAKSKPGKTRKKKGE